MLLSSKKASPVTYVQSGSCVHLVSLARCSLLCAGTPAGKNAPAGKGAPSTPAAAPRAAAFSYWMVRSPPCLGCRRWGCNEKSQGGKIGVRKRNTATPLRESCLRRGGH
jgi:hypothetical protein